MEIEKLQELCKNLLKVKGAIDKLKEEKTELEKEFAAMKAEAVEHLEEHGLKNFDHGMGKISIMETKSVKMLDKYVFFEWLKEKGTFEDVVSVNAMTLKSLYKQELELAIERQDVNFLQDGLPGVSEPSTFRSIKFLK